jgi:transposase InsO family protein
MTTPPAHIQRVVEVRKNDLEKSKYEIQEELKREGILLGTSTIQKIINHHSQLLNTQHQRKIRSRKKLSIARIKAAKDLKDKYPGSLVQIDTKHLYILNQRFYLFAALDCQSRMGYISVKKTGSSKSGEEFLNEAVESFPFRIEAIQTDNGSEYLLHFHQRCEELGIKHYFTDPQCPKQNGRVERFIQTAVYEFFNHQEDLLDDLEMIQKKCQEFNFRYNHQRFHQVLAYKTPVEYLEETSEYANIGSESNRSKVYGMWVSSTGA